MYIKVHVVPESRDEKLIEKKDVLYVWIREKAEHGAANRRVCELLLSHFGKGKRLRIVSGHHSPHKIISID